MPIEGDYAPSPFEFAADQVEQYERTGGAEGGDLQGRPVVILTTRGRTTGKVRKSPLMRVTDGDRYAVVASRGGAPEHPVWYLNILADPHVTLQDGPVVKDYVARRRGGREGRMVGPRQRDLARLRRVPDQDRPPDPGGGARTGRLTPTTLAGAAGAGQGSASGGSWASREMTCRRSLG
jgi:deazaflavin-dependent oxidoreductase (nitroreductase family)